MTCLHGDAGVGKTLGASIALRTIGCEQMIWPWLRFSSTARTLREKLFHALVLDGPVPHRPAAVDALLHEALARRRYALVLDDVQNLNADCLRLIRSLWDAGDSHSRPAVVFIGDQRGYKKLRREQAARISTWNRIDRLGADEVRTAAPAFHHEWAKVPLNLIGKADAYGPQGRIRSGLTVRWACPGRNASPPAATQGCAARPPTHPRV
ncbi:hypothetical protein C9F11_47095 (plasmid) [Streptomyces sp. YIM 121038]|nr:hypothetical protein C9F11_00085 [Streptomyces sp. YIM 121038]QCX82099.1 hypothetical protein C9F11_42595 [Streptomyces sp. YIM 121038]QCX82132.1 hypothetical protein C9F11_42760 [Streptomyces sp. YIM 121038]QCX82966.1 hypothetical protein C9F11_47095 [Streptomyces sp. YIM 121038]